MSEVKLGLSELAEACDTAPVSEGFRNDLRILTDHIERQRNPEAAEDEAGDGSDGDDY